ncbi:hypothetical protein MRX96_031913 [Rhipicephalus microplus]
MDDWYSCISDRIPANDFAAIINNCTAMVNHGSINRINARKALRAASKTPKTWGSFLKTFFVAMTTAFSGSSSLESNTEDNYDIDYQSYASLEGTSAVNTSVPAISQYDQARDFRIYIMCAIDTCIAFRIFKDADGEESNEDYAQVMTILKNFYEAEVQYIQSSANSATDDDE